MWKPALLLLAIIPPLGSETLNTLVSDALAHNAELLAARQRLAEAQGLLLQSGLRPNPAIDVSVSNGSLLASPGEREVSLGYAHTFELGGKRDKRIETGRIGLELARAEVADRERLLKAEVKERFADAMAAARNLESAERLMELNEQSYQIAQARTKEGEGTALEEGLLRVEVSRIRSDRLLFANQVERAVLELKTLSGRPLAGDLRLDGGLASPDVKLTLEAAVKQALSTRPDLQAARVLEDLGNAELRLAHSQAMPDLVASGRYSRASSRFDQYGLAGLAGPVVPLRDTDNLLTAGISIVLPLRNRNQGNIQAAVARREVAAMRLRSAEQVVRREVNAALGRYQTARQALAVFDDGVLRQSAENVRILRAAYDLGEIRLMDVINEQRRLVDTQRAHTELLKEAYVAAVELERAVGADVF